MNTDTTNTKALTDQARRRYFAAFRSVFGAAGSDTARRELQLLVVGKPSAARDAARPMTIKDFDGLTARLAMLAAYRRSGGRLPAPAPKPEPEPKDEDAEYDRIVKNVRVHGGSSPSYF